MKTPDRFYFIVFLFLTSITSNAQVSSCDKLKSIIQCIRLGSQQYLGEPQIKTEKEPTQFGSQISIYPKNNAWFVTRKGSKSPYIYYEYFAEHITPEKSLSVFNYFLYALKSCPGAEKLIEKKVFPETEREAIYNSGDYSIHLFLRKKYMKSTYYVLLEVSFMQPEDFY